MTDFLTSKNFNGIKPDLQRAITKYQQPNLFKALWQLANTFITPYPSSSLPDSQLQLTKSL